MIDRRKFLRAGSVSAAAFALHRYSLHEPASAMGASTFVLGSLEEPGSLSALANLPHHFPADVPQTLLFDSLTQFMPDSTVEPKLATRWDVSADELTYTFTLDDAAAFHDGTPVTADDVVFTVEACLDPSTNSSSEGFENVASVTAIDEHTVRFNLSEITPSFLAQGGARGIVPRHALEGKDIAADDFNQTPVGSGPYRLVSYIPGEALILEAVANHHRETPTIPRVEFRILSDQNVLLTQLLSGQLTYGLVAPQDLEVFERTDAVNIVEVPTPRFYSIIPNYRQSWWNDVEVRSAILGAIDREGIVSGILLGHGAVINANVTPASWAYATESVVSHPYDPQAAEQALDAAGWVREGQGARAKNGTELTFTVTINSFDRTLQRAMLVAQQNLAQIGIPIDIEIVEPGVFSDRQNSGDFDALARIWNPVYDPDQCSLLHTDGNFNFYEYSNADVDALCEEAMSTIEKAARSSIYAGLQQQLSQDLPQLFLYSENELHAFASSVTGLEPHPVNVFWNFATWTID